MVKTFCRPEHGSILSHGGHGRALEILKTVQQSHSKSLETINPIYIVEQVIELLTAKYGNLFAYPLFDAATCQEVLAAIISQRRYEVGGNIGGTSLTVDDLQSLGLFQRTREGYLECAFIFLVILMRRIPKIEGEVDNFDDHITDSVLVWQRFEHFVGFYRGVKSFAYHNVPMTLSAFHAGTLFGPIDGVEINEPKSRKVLEAVCQYETKSGSGIYECTTPRDSNKKLSDMNTIILNGPSATAGDLFMSIELTTGCRQVLCNEVLQCKLLQTKKKLRESDYAKERGKAVNLNSDVFLLITSGGTNKFGLPPRCGLVSIAEFQQYFGPFASRAYRRFLVPPDINVASYRELCRVEGLGAQLAARILAERERGRFSSVEDAVNRVFKNHFCKTANVVRGLYCVARAQLE